MIKLGFMQGRLVPPEQNKIQSFPWKNWDKEFKIANDIKLNLMEWTIDKENFHQNPINNTLGIKKIKKLTKKFNIKINSITCDFFMQSPFFKKKNYQTLNELKYLITNCGKLNIKYIVLPLVDGGAIKNQNYERIFISQIKKLQKNLEKNKVKLIFESDFKPKKLLKFINKLPSKNFGINYDLGNSAGLDISFEEEKIYFHRVYNIHLKDKNKKNISVDLGNGVGNFKDLFEYCKKINYKGNYILQTARNKNDIGIIKKNIKFIKKFYDKN
ncbi:sugar phosphate isomerase/epimerase [Candidatus Pelagibacter sp.]|nr:sugar phosphate isomerase/epimerase [Candidatus Pelagibacter sp.]